VTKAALVENLKDAILLSLRDNRDAVRDLIAEVMEDVALTNAIRDGQRSKPVRRDAVMKALSRRK
jgi:hypothetical protein